MATTRKMALSAIDGDANNQLALDTQIEINRGDVTPLPATQQYVIFRLVNKKVRRLTLDGICDGVLNPKTNQYERIRLIRGQHSIWTSELTEFLKDKDYVSKNRIGLQFVDGICRVGVHETMKLEYARHHTSNVGKERNIPGKYNYYEYDAAEEQRMRYDKQVKRINLLQLISSMDAVPMKKLALFLGVKPSDEEIGIPKTEAGFRRELLLKADTQPDIVERFLNSKEVEVSYLVRRAIMENKIDLGGSTGTVVWAAGQGFIAKIPIGRKPLEFLTELAMSHTKEGQQFKEQLESIVT